MFEGRICIKYLFKKEKEKEDMYRKILKI